VGGGGGIPRLSKEDIEELEEIMYWYLDEH
jgi:hypothetical protein